MTGNKSHWIVAGLLVVIAVLGTLLAVQLWQRSDPLTAFAQMGPGISNNIVVLLGQGTGNNSDRVPLYVIDTQQRTILVYEYTYSRRQLYFRLARNYAADSNLDDYGYGSTDIYAGPTVQEIRDIVRSRLKAGGTPPYR